MNTSSLAPVQYWLLIADLPTGPFTVEQVHAEISAGRVHGDTRASLVGGQGWQPLRQFPGFGTLEEKPLPKPPTLLQNSPAPLVPYPKNATSGSPTLPTSPPAPDRLSLAIFLGMALGALGILGWLGYQVNEWLRPYTPMEVCQKLQEAKTPLEAKNYTTPRMQTWIEQVYKEQTPEDPNDQFEFTRETEGPQLGIKMVGFRGSTWFPEVGQRKKMEGYFRLILSSGWKIDDMVFTGVEGMALEKPVSIVELFQGEAARNAASKFKSTNQGTLPPAPRRGLLGAYDSIQNQLGWGRFFVLLLVAGGILGLWEKIKK